MKHRGHSYRNSVAGRSLETHAGIGGTSFVAHMRCSRCPCVGTRNLRAIMPPEHIDRKFLQAGWSLDPHTCPDCLKQASQERKTMSAKPSPTAMRAQAQMFTMLQTHFDTDKGAFAKEWSDDRVATETGLAKALVVEFRQTCFGELKEPDEVRALRSDISALETLARETNASFAAEIASLRTRLAAISSRWGA
ncbi:hypothetical protein [Sphingobium sp.]|uniref:hypothetical protein n=1 Tax=Sphingobium sp. TaxID=1912891 RepID=UPI003BB667A9